MDNSAEFRLGMANRYIEIDGYSSWLDTHFSQMPPLLQWENLTHLLEMCREFKIALTDPLAETIPNIDFLKTGVEKFEQMVKDSLVEVFAGHPLVQIKNKKDLFHWCDGFDKYLSSTLEEFEQAAFSEKRKRLRAINSLFEFLETCEKHIVKDPLDSEHTQYVLKYIVKVKNLLARRIANFPDDYPGR